MFAFETFKQFKDFYFIIRKNNQTVDAIRETSDTLLLHFGRAKFVGIFKQRTFSEKLF